MAHRARFAAQLAALVGALALGGGAFADTGGAGAPVISHVTNKPVPRFEALRFNTVNGRNGPGRDHPIAWQYSRAGLPVLILKETNAWRYVRDPAGDEVWIHERMLRPATTALALEQATLVADAREGARPRAYVEAGAIVTLGRCEAGYCHVSSGRAGGWAPRSVLWGAPWPAPVGGASDTGEAAPADIAG
ncbi:MAG: SH3 domain-containing protein [Pseudomonadota bacterium]